MKTLKSIDGKSLLIGGLLACTIFIATGSTSPEDKWDNGQMWEFDFFDIYPPEDQKKEQLINQAKADIYFGEKYDDKDREARGRKCWLN